MNLEELKAKLEQLKNTVPLDVVEMNKVQQQILELSSQQTATAQVAVTDAKKYDFTTDFDDAFGVTFLNDTVQSVLDGVKAEIAGQYNSKLDEKDAEYSKLAAQIDELRAQLKQANDDKTQALSERDDFENKLHNATTQLDEAGKQIEQQKGWIADLQKQIAEAPLPANRIDVTPVATNLDTEGLKKKLAEERANKPKVYNLRKGDEKGSFYVAEDEKGEEINIPYLELGRYQVLQFREPTTSQVDAQPTQTSVEPPAKLEIPQFQGTQEVPAAPAGVVNQEQGVPHAGATLEERVAALESKVAALEQTKAGQAA